MKQQQQQQQQNKQRNKQQQQQTKQQQTARTQKPFRLGMEVAAYHKFSPCHWLVSSDAA